MTGRAGLLPSLVLAFLAMATPLSAAPYWADKGYSVPGICPNFTEPVEIKVGNYKGVPAEDIPATRISGMFECTDEGDKYRMSVKFLAVAIEPETMRQLPQQLHFTWLGVAIYRNNGAGDLDWLYDEAYPIDGYLQRDSTEPIYFGNIEFVYDKQMAESAEFFTLYLTFNNTLNVFGVYQ